MTKVLILGASGQIARWVVKALADDQDIRQTLLLRDPGKLAGNEPGNAQVVIGNVLEPRPKANPSRGPWSLARAWAI